MALNGTRFDGSHHTHNPQMRMSFLEEAPSHADDLIQRAYRWILDNPHGWRYIERMARDDAARGGRVRVKRYIEDLRDDPTVAYERDHLKLPNGFSAPFGRFLAAWNPDIAEYIPMASSKVDGCAIPRRPSA